ncbi:ABC transporter permease [Paenibacillus crassostreae]|uniref:Transport permease protein n=1 Tax=Paenibacillus crassostreae TaxID=1763538 RepID=A0A167BAP1_9BACL|nr:ABC transporter permease [Paenibacillus crassostreae]AOZ93018.1 ABC transporter [Paenibacillus crassostreae]OAB71894.1 ABC transporter [Paenibacillus crassostreae]
MIIILKTMLAGIFRDVHTLILTIMLPIALLIGLGLYFDSPAYSERLVVGILTTNLLFGATMVTAFNVMAQRNRGIYKLLRVTPFSTTAFICSMTGARAVLTMLVSFIIILLSVFVFGITVSLSGIAFMLLTLLVATICFTAIGFITANVSRDENNVNMISNLFSFPMLFTSEAFYSMQNTPDWLQNIARLQPFHYFVQAMSAALHPTGPTEDVWIFLAVLIGFAILCLLVAVLTFRWDTGISIGKKLKSL